VGLVKLRKGGFHIPTDEEDEAWVPRPPRKYY
jgi:hypothetical protein